MKETIINYFLYHNKNNLIGRVAENLTMNWPN